MQLFDLINSMFTSPEKYGKARNLDKSKNFFMINRRFAIKFPTQANMFNHIKSPGAKVVDCWSWVARSVGKGKVPYWMYTKTKKPKKPKTKKSKKRKGFNPDTYEPKEESLQKFLNLHELGMKDYELALSFNKEETLKKLYEYEERRDLL